MNVFRGSYLNELRKLRSYKKFYVFLIVEILIVALFGVISYAMQRVTGQELVMQSLVSGVSMTLLGFFVEIYIPLVVFMAASDVFPAEIQDGTNRAILMRPVSREKIYFSKCLAVFTMAVVYLVTLFVMTTLMQVIFGKTFSGTFAAFASYFVDIIPMAVFVLFVCMVCQIGTSTSLSVILCIIIYIALYAAGIVMPALGSTLFTGYLMWHTIWIGIMLPVRAIIVKLGLLAGYALVFSGAGFYLFERKEA